MLKILISNTRKGTKWIFEKLILIYKIAYRVRIVYTDKYFSIILFASSKLPLSWYINIEL